MNIYPTADKYLRYKTPTDEYLSHSR